MKKSKLFTASMATTVVVASVVTPFVSASGLQDIWDSLKSEQTKSVYDVVAMLDSTKTAETTASTTSTKGTDKLHSANDEERRQALAKILGVSLDEFDIWKGEVRETPSSLTNLTDKTTYAMNENRQTLIKYGSKTGDWQPYYWYSAMQNPSHYELVNGKVVLNKNYYAYVADYTLNNIRMDIGYAHNDGDKELEEKLTTLFESELKKVVENYNKAPGLAVYSVLLHGILRDRTDLNVTPVDESYWKSPWRNPSVLSGKSIDGTNPFKTIVEGLQDGTITGSLTGGYKEVSTKSTTSTDTKTETKTN